MKETIAENQSLQYKNVISTYYSTTLSDLSLVLEEFLTTVFNAGYTADGPFFYAINSDMSKKGEILIQTFIPVSESHHFDLPEDFIYQNYFQVLDLVATRALGDTEVSISNAFSFLFSYIQKRRLKVRTPVFYLVTIGDNEEVYTDLYVGIDYLD